MKEKKGTRDQIRQIIMHGDFEAVLSKISIDLGISQVQATLEAETYLEELYAEHDATTNFLFIEVFQYLISQGYDKNIDVDPIELNSLAKLMRKHPVAFVLTHKSYIDLIVLMVVLARYGLPLPFLFAGINLDMWGIGKVVRKNGVIFIRRSFKDNPIYKATLRHFISYLLQGQSHFMWAIEGTRSRTGKLVWPQMGILKYIAEAEEKSRTKVKYLPISIVYDLIPDVEDMTSEVLGKAKKPETIKWMIGYLKKMTSQNLGRISLRIGEPLDLKADKMTEEIVANPISGLDHTSISRLAFSLIHDINAVTPVTTLSLICNALLSKFALTKRGVESNVSNLMYIIENHKLDVLVDRGQPIGESVQKALNLLLQAGIIKHKGEGGNTKYTINRSAYLQATYYANMSVHHLVHRSFIELAMLKIKDEKLDRRIVFWKEIMSLRDFFKFEFFYTSKPRFTEEIEKELQYMLGSNWDTIFNPRTNISLKLKSQTLLVSPVILSNYLEAYKVVASALLMWEQGEEFNEKSFLDHCMFLGEEMHWLGQIKRAEAVALPFLQNGILLAKNQQVWLDGNPLERSKIEEFHAWVEDINSRVNLLLGFTLEQRSNLEMDVPVERSIIPGSKTEKIVAEVLSGEKGAHIGAFFDLDRTLINGFSAKNFVTTRIKSGKFTSKELVSQLAGALAYAKDTGNFAKMAAISTNGVKGVPEQIFIDLGEEVYQKTLAASIIPESRALVAAHLKMGHTVTIVSAATPYQVMPIARDLGIDIVACTRLEVAKGKFTGKIIEPACWGEGKAIAGRDLAQKYKLDLSKSFFYTDSAEDLSLLEIVGNPRPVNPDMKLADIAFQNDWPMLRFTDFHSSKLESVIRTAVSFGSIAPALVIGLTNFMKSFSFEDGVESMIQAIGEYGTKAAGISLSIKGEEHIWSHRPAVFILNHQSNADLLIVIKLIKKDARGVAKMELKKLPIVGQILEAAGTIFLDRTDKDKAIEALKPAVESLQKGMSIVIFPEGTRSYDYTLGRFKKGAFHLAMQAGVPIVPIILKNAHDAMPRGQNLFQPTLVEVIVSEPILTHDWTNENLNDKIEEIRKIYLKELKQ